MKLASIEAARVLSAINVVVCHVAGVSVGGAFLLTALSVALTVRVDDRPRLFSERARRLLLPWVCWSLFYLAPRFVHAWRHGEPLGRCVEFDMLLYGSSIHLWYLPFAFVATALASYALAMVRSRTVWLLGAALALAVAGVVYRMVGDVFPLPQWMLGTSAVLLGLGLRSVRPGTSDLRQAVLTTLLIWGAGVVAYEFGGLGIALPATVGTALLCAAWTIRVEAPRWLSGTASLGYGVYLLHPAVLWLVNPMKWGPATTTATAVAASAGLSIALHRVRLGRLNLRWLV